MTLAEELAALFERDLGKLIREVQAFPAEDLLWRRLPGVSNSAGNLTLHLEGNLREYVGRLLGGIVYRRVREQEFASEGVEIAELAARIEDVKGFVPRIVGDLTEAQMDAGVPDDPLGAPLSTRRYLIHLHAHLNYHLGQIDYLRRVLTGGSAV
jgi:hypothetical protein